MKKEFKILSKIAVTAVLTAVVAVGAAFTGSAPVSAAKDYSAVFDASYYSNRYSDLKTAFGNSSARLLNHFINCGMKEGRRGSDEFDFSYYYSNNADLRAAFGGNRVEYYEHYINWGKREGRLGCPPTEYGGIDYSAVYDPDYYYNAYPDLQAAFGNNRRALIWHFVTSGMREGRSASYEFDLSYYYSNNADLRAAFGGNNEAYYRHYMNSGINEGRPGCSPTVYNGIDYSAVYNPDYYYNAYPDLRAAFGYNRQALIWHFVTSGMREGRRASENFNPTYYRNMYFDLQNAFGSDNEEYYRHYMCFGKNEGRLAASPTEYGGVDYSSVYDPDYYYNAYPDLQAAFGYNRSALIWHFATSGMREGRRGNEEFDINEYIADIRENDPNTYKALGENKLFYYYRKLGISMRGIDVSRHNGAIDWNKVKASGVEFAIIRIGYGDDLEKQDDVQAVRNMDECERLGIPYGVYLYSYAVNFTGEASVESEIAHTLRMLNGRNPQLGVWYDIEDEDQDHIPKETLTEMVVYYLKLIEAQGYRVGVYASLNMWNNRLNDPVLDNYEKWIAHWTDAATCGYNKPYRMWQYTSDGSVNGIDGRVDLDIYYY